MKIATPRLPCLAQAFLRSSSGWPSNSQCSVMGFTYCCELHVSQERTLLVCEDVQGRGRLCPVLPDPLRVRIPLSFRGFFPGVSRGFYSPLWDMPECFWTGSSFVLVPGHPCPWRLALVCSCSAADPETRLIAVTTALFPACTLPSHFSPTALLCHSQLWKVLTVSLAITVSSSC